jgi:hypothetical protein
MIIREIWWLPMNTQMHDLSFSERQEMSLSLKSRLGSTLGALTVALLVLAGSVPAEAADSHFLTPEQEQQAREVFNEYGVSSATQDELFNKLDRGEVWDVYAGVAPVSSVTSIVDGYTQTLDTFADGSISVSGVEIPKEPTPTDGFSTMSVTGCTYGSGAGVFYGQDCRVYQNSALTEAEFYASFSQWSTGSSVSNWHDGWVIRNVGQLQNVGWSHGTTWVQLGWDEVVEGWSSTHKTLKLNTTSTSVWSSGF